MTATHIQPYPNPGGLATSADLSVDAGGEPLWVEALTFASRPDEPAWFRNSRLTAGRVVNVAAFACDGPCPVAIRPRVPVTSAVVRPKSLAIPVEVEGDELRLSLPGPCRLLVELDALPPLLLFAEPPEVATPPGEGARIFAPGVHDVGLMELHDGQEVYLAPGAIVYGGLRGSPRGARVHGGGILDGSRLDERLVVLQGARGVRFEGLTMRGGRSWHNTLIDCEDVTYRDVKILSHTAGGDGIDPVCSRNVRIERCFFRCSDDCVAVKALRGGPPVSGIHVSDCVMAGYAFSDGFTVGFEADTSYMEEITVERCDVLCALGGNRVDGHSAFSVICDGPAEVRNVRFAGLRVEENVLKLFELHVTDGQKYTHRPPGHIRGVHLEGIRWEAARPIILHGHDEGHLVEDVTFAGCTIAGRPLEAGDLQVNPYVRGVRISG